MKENIPPWSGLEDPIYETEPLKERKAWVNKAAGAISLVFIAGGIYYMYPVLSLLGVLCILALVMKKDTVLTIRGIETFYRMKIAAHYEIWKWEEIDRMASEINDAKYGKERLAVYFRKNDRAKCLCLAKSKYSEIIELAKSRNKDIKVENE